MIAPAFAPHIGCYFCNACFFAEKNWISLNLGTEKN
jgi:hypothetical protein